MESQRHLFDIPDGITYLNCAYMSPQLRAVTEAGKLAVERKSQPWTVSSADFFSEVEELRALFATLVNGDTEGASLIPAVSYGVAIACRNVNLSEGDRIIVLDEQFPSNVYGWQVAAARSGAEVITVTRGDGGDWTPEILKAIDDRTKVVATPNIHWTDGSIVDVAAVAAATREAGGIYVVDATQSLGALPFDVADVKPDYLIAGGYKTLLGPYSLGYLWVAEEHRLGVPIEENWMARSGSEDFTALVNYKADYQPGARRFDVGEKSNFVLVPMAMAALSQLLEWSPAEVATAVGALTDHLEVVTAGMGLSPTPAAGRGPNMIGVRAPQGLPPDLGMKLAAEDIFVSVRGDSIRVAPHVYNEPADMDRLAEALSRLL